MVEIIMPLDINLFCNDEINHLIYETIFYQNDESDILSGIVNLFLPDESYNDYYDKNNITTVFDKAILLYEILQVMLSTKLKWLRKNNYNTLTSVVVNLGGVKLWVISE